MRWIAFLGIFVVVTAPVASQSVYRWVDENGEVHYSQTLPPERVRGEHARLTRDGRVEESVERAPTEEERKALIEQLRLEQDQVKAERIRAQQNRLFLAAFPTEDDVRHSIAAREAALKSERDSVASLINQTRQRFNQSVAAAADRERQGQPVPKYLSDQIAAARDNLAEMHARLSRLDERLGELDEMLATELARHRQLTDSG